MSFDIRIDIDPVITCPYDKNHKIARSRIQHHLVKCERNFPRDWRQQCPYDATHRVFAHEMVEHVTNCKMKFTNPIPIDNYNTTRISEVEPELEFKIESDENWDECNGDEDKNNRYNEPTFETINVKQYTNFTSNRGNSLTSRRDSCKLRRPYGYSESMMLDISNQTIDDDTESVTSNMGIGRGQNLANQSARGQYIRGAGRIYRSYRGR